MQTFSSAGPWTTLRCGEVRSHRTAWHPSRGSPLLRAERVVLSRTSYSSIRLTRGRPASFQVAMPRPLWRWSAIWAVPALRTTSSSAAWTRLNKCSRRGGRMSRRIQLSPPSGQLGRHSSARRRPRPSAMRSATRRTWSSRQTRQQAACNLTAGAMAPGRRLPSLVKATHPWFSTSRTMDRGAPRSCTCSHSQHLWRRTLRCFSSRTT
mmetsp:Transcript_24978/g.73360  ORF Transcript_24978/g.73360 Transcript_24978/m.73360 type:complete len:208 (+) Transcript_24978:565-1188(+)